jgi:hypothetical protein
VVNYKCSNLNTILLEKIKIVSKETFRKHGKYVYDIITDASFVIRYTYMYNCYFCICRSIYYRKMRHLIYELWSYCCWQYFSTHFWWLNVFYTPMTTIMIFKISSLSYRHVTALQPISSLPWPHCLNRSHAPEYYSSFFVNQRHVKPKVT